MTTQALLVAQSDAYRDWLTHNLSDDVTILPADADEPDALGREVDTTPGVGLIFLEFTPDNADRARAMLDKLQADKPGLPVIAVGDREHSDTVLTAMRAGASDFLVLRRDDAQLPELVDRVLRRRSGSREPTSGGASRKGTVLTAFAGHPSPSVPFLALHMALALEKQVSESERVLLFDLSFPGGASLVFLDIDQNYSALDALRDVYRCDETLIDTAFTRLEDGMYLLTLPEERVDPVPVDAEEVGQLIDALSNYFAYVVVAADAAMPLAALTAVIGHSDKALLMTDQSVLKSRQCKHMLHALRQADLSVDNVGLVVDHYQPNLGLDAQRLSQLLELECAATLSGKSQSRIEAMNAGESMFEHAPRDTYSREVLALVERMTGRSVELSAQKSGLLGRLFR